MRHSISRDNRQMNISAVALHYSDAMVKIEFESMHLIRYYALYFY